MFGIVFTMLSLCCAALCDICDDETLPYQVGIQTTLLDISADAMSSLQGDCSKNIAIRGASTSTIHVDEAGYGRNMYYEYLGNNGVVPKFETDRADILFGKCSNLNAETNQSWLEVKTGFTHSFNGSSICLKFLPNKKSYAFIGGHDKGSRITIRITVNVGQCSSYGAVGPVDMQCVPLCSVHGLIRSCPSTETMSKAFESSTKKSTVSRFTSVYSFTSFLTTETSSASHAAPALTSEMIFNTRKTYLPTPGSIVTPFVANLDMKHTSATKVNSTTNTAHIAFSTKRNVSPTARHSAIQTIGRTTWSSTYPDAFLSGKFNVHSLTTAKVIHKTSPTSRMSGSTESSSPKYPANSLKGPTVDESTTATKSHSMISLTTSTSSTATAAGDDTLFGFVEGLYMLFGCILLLVTVIALACSVKRRRLLKLYPSASQCHTITNSSSSADIHWRDNWLVRYHSNAHPDDTSSQPESVQCIHGNFVNQSNPELHHIHGERFRGKYEQESQYHDPWPLVRLDSDFVNRTKSIERTTSGDENPVGYALAMDVKSEGSLASSELRANELFGNEATNKYLFSNCYTTDEHIQNEDKSETISTVESTRYKKREGSYSTTKGTYSVVRLIRRYSPKSENAFNDLSTSIRDTSTGLKVFPRSDVVYHEIDDFPVNTGPIPREVSRSSMCSDSSLTIEDMLPKEVREIELGMPMEGTVCLDDMNEKADKLQENGDLDADPMYATMSKHVRTFSRLGRELDNNVVGTETPSYRVGASGTMQFPK